MTDQPTTEPAAEPGQDAGPGTAYVQVVVNALGKGTVVLDGTDLSSDVRAVHLSAGVGNIPTVTLDVIAGFSYEGPGLVSVVGGPITPDVAKAFLTGWLNNIDWQSISGRAAVGTMSLSIGEAFHHALLTEVESPSGG